ncbi:hypothetical protein N7486_006269 [Penicillium sp. IBT 16267x]|nr:hypothetical protein N7486_006269 [Penicillium sp. IBT 16267x]
MKGFVGGIPLALLVAAVQVQAMEQGPNGMDMSQSSFHQRRAAGFHPAHFGGTAMGGPSGKDEDGTSISPYSVDVHTHTNVNEHHEDNHSIKIKDKNVFPPSFGPGPALGPGAGPFAHAYGPGAGPFPKRSWPSGGTVEGGPSGDDEGQSFNMPITGIFNTEVNEYSKDDHSVHVKNKDIHPGPVIEAPAFHPPPDAAGHPNGPGGHRPFRMASGQSSSNKFKIPVESFGKRFTPGGTAMGGPGGGDSYGPESEGKGFPDGGDSYGPESGRKGFPFVAGGTAMGGPSGDDEDISWGAPQTAHIKTNVNEYYKDDHSISIKNKDVHPPSSHPPFGFPKRGLYPHSGGTAMGGPSGDDGGQSFNMPITIETDTAVNEHYQDDHSIDVKHKDVYPAPHFPSYNGGRPWRRAYSPDSANREGGDDDDDDDFSPPIIPGGTGMGGPSGDDDGENFGSPTDVDVDTSVNENHDDNHAIKLDTTTVHPSSWDFHPAPVYPAPVHPAPAHEVHEAPVPTVPQEVPQMPWMSYPDQQHAAGVPAESHPTPEAPEHHEIPAHSEPTPPAHRAQEEKVPECSAQVHEVVRTVTETQYKQVQATETVYQRVPVSSQGFKTSAVPTHAVPMESGSGPKVKSSAVPTWSSSNPKVMSSAVPTWSSSNPKVMSSAAPTWSSSNVPYASYPSSAKSSMSAPAAKYSQVPVYVPKATPSSAASMMPWVTTASSNGVNKPTGVSPEQSAFPSSSGHATPSKGVMFTGAASRVSGGIVSAAVAVVGVLAFVL